MVTRSLLPLPSRTWISQLAMGLHRSAVLVALAGSGCFVPRPEHYQRIPDLSGIVVESGIPVRDAAIWSSEDRFSCHSVSAVTKTGPDGSFQLAGLRRFRLGTVVTGGDPGLGWSVCIQPRAQREVLHQTESIMGYEAPGAMELRCDLTHADLCERVSITR